MMGKREGCRFTNFRSFHRQPFFTPLLFSIDTMNYTVSIIQYNKWVHTDNAPLIVCTID